MVERIARSASTVTVACKLPAGLILELWDMQDVPEGSPTGTRTIKKAVKKTMTGCESSYKLNGSALPFGMVPDFPLPGGYALTTIPAAFWEEWCRQNADADVLLSRNVFAHASQDDTAAQAREQARNKVKSGFEPIDPKNPPKVGMKITPATVA
jgi:hypothetical protein